MGVRACTSTRPDRFVHGFPGRWPFPETVGASLACQGVPPVIAHGRPPRAKARCAVTTLRTPRSETLLASPGLVPGAFLRVLQRPPLRRHGHGVPRPGRPRTPFVLTLPSARCDPPSWFLTTLTVPPPTTCRHVAACCRPWGSPGLGPPRRAHATPGPPLRCHTLQSVPLAGSRTRVTAGRCPLAVPPHAVRKRPRGLAPPSSPLRAPLACAWRTPDALLGFPLPGAPACRQHCAPRCAVVTRWFRLPPKRTTDPSTAPPPVRPGPPSRPPPRGRLAATVPQPRGTLHPSRRMGRPGPTSWVRTRQGRRSRPRRCPEGTVRPTCATTGVVASRGVPTVGAARP